MHALATTSKSEKQNSHTSPAHKSPGLEMRAQIVTPTIYRKGSCACGGGCPSCKSETGGLNVSHPNDSAELEADAIADQVMRMQAGPPTPNLISSGSAENTIHRKCDSCEQKDEEKIQRKSLSNSSPSTSAQPGHVGSVIAAGGEPLGRSARNFFEPRLGYDLSGVRIHKDTAAGASARDVDARAYTLGSNIVFGAGEYDPETEGGKHLLAHELAHVVQNSNGGRRETIHRTLKIDKAGSDDPATAVSMLTPLITGLCPDFEIDATDFVVPKSGTPCSFPRFAAVRASSNPLGCCCLCTMTRPFGPQWTIVVSATDAPTTDSSTHEVRMTPTSGPTAPELRFWTGAPQTVAPQPAVEAFGHELCGHAALLKIRAHPTHSGNTDRSYSDIHDPTVRIQNALATEMGLPGPRRGLAGSGSHRGESLRVFTVGPFPANDVDITPFATQIASAAAFLNGSTRLLYDTVGFRDATDTTASVSATRAANVKTAVDAAVTTPTHSVETTPGVPEVITRSQPARDGGATGSRNVEIQIAVRPAGLIAPPGAAPPATPVHVDEESPGRVAFLKGPPGSTKGGINECHKLLVETAWP